MVVSEILAIFLEHVGRDRKPATVRQYRTRLKSFADKFGSRDFSSIDSLEIEAWLGEAGKFPDGRLKSPDTRRANAIAFEQLQAFAVDHHALAEKLLEKIRKPTGRLRERIPTDSETQAILDAASPQFRLIYQALRQTGARPNELAGAQFADIDRQAGMLVIRHHKTEEKTGRPRKIAIGKKFAELIAQARGGRTEGPIFLSPRLKPWTTGTLSATFRRLRDRLRLPKDLCLYLTRHEHASRLCRQRGIQAAAEALGHKSIVTTKRYVKTDDKELQENQDLV